MSSLLSTDKTTRKAHPMARGLLDYFPKALAAVSNVSFVANEQHNPGQPMHWAREKSTDHADCIVRHLVERGTVDDDGLRHSAKTAWRALALLEIELEEAEGAGGDGLCDCTVADPCPLGRTGSSPRCTEEELKFTGHMMAGTDYTPPVPKASEPDAFCITTPDGGCVSTDPRCMHNKHDAMPPVPDGAFSILDDKGQPFATHIGRPATPMERGIIEGCGCSVCSLPPLPAPAWPVRYDEMGCPIPPAGPPPITLLDAFDDKGERRA